MCFVFMSGCFGREGWQWLKMTGDGVKKAEGAASVSKDPRAAVYFLPG